MHYFLLAFISSFMRNICNKEFSKRFITNESNVFYQSIILSVTCLISAIVGGLQLPTSLFLFLATIHAFVFVATVYLMIICYRKGPMGLVSLVLSMSSILPVLVGLIGFKEEMNLYKGIGLTCALSVLILSWRDRESKSSTTKYKYISPRVWLPTTVLCMVLNGTLSSIQNMVVHWSPTGNKMIFNFWTYLIASIICWIIVIILKMQGKNFLEISREHRSFCLFSLLSGIGCAGGNLMIMMALDYIPSSICYPLMSTLSTSAVFLLSLLYYKEGHSKFGYLMLVFSILGILSFSLA